MAKTYRNFNELARVVKETLVVDLAPHALNLNPELKATLIDEEPGIYISNLLNPIFPADGEYFLVDRVDSVKYGLLKNNPQGLIPLTFKDLFNHIFNNGPPIGPGHIFNQKTGTVTKRTVFEHIKPMLRPAPQISVRAIEAGLATVVSYLNNLCRYTCVLSKQYVLETLVKPEFKHVLEKNDFEAAFDDLHLQINQFVGNDTWCQYQYRLNGTSLIVEKGLDFRIMDWHRKKIQESPGFDHDLGGVSDGYEISN